MSFWFTRDSAASAGKKAFVYNRIGDVGFLLAIFLVYDKVHSLDYQYVFAHIGQIGSANITAICLLLLVGVMGKSAQIPLFPWLADAMEGPTPVSALIHAATMVTAGVYLLCRVNPLLHASPDAALTIAIVGAATAFVAATIACAQQDIKKVLAYSTVSQLGYMFLAIGCGAYTAAIFLMVAHAFFKGLLFLGRRLGDPRAPRRAGPEAHGQPAGLPADHLHHLRHRLAVHRRRAAAVGLLGQGRRPRQHLGRPPGPVGRRHRHRRADRLLHEPPDRPGLLRLRPVGRAGATPTSSTPPTPTTPTAPCPSPTSRRGS